ncbi:dihydroorotase [uncultured Muribaculum sp.]|uniref:dihydroorotase n=1 Tax=uncultured Muribaculum sp. TaxID=1918613 RepID=UPI002598F256|nr:dihydroorotase [uncultured Muribaculum sp.]
MKHDLILFNGTIINENRSFKGYIVIDGELITDVAEGSPDKTLIENATDAIDVKGAYILPGAIDDQVHFRDPGLTHKGDIFTESRAAAAGGVTSFMDMPNTKPPTVSTSDVEWKLAHAANQSAVNYSFFIGATNDNLDELLKCDYSRVPGVKLFLGSSTGNMLVDNEETLNRIFRDVPAIIAIHSEDEATIRENRDKIAHEYNGEVPVRLHPAIRSREACIISTRRAIDRARKYGSRLHVLHVSTAEEIEMFSTEPLDKKLITAEVCAHHLWFSDADYDTIGTRVKMNPAVKTAADRDALRQGLRDGRLDIVATDHAPHLLSEKEGNALTAASGAPMVQFSLPVMLELADRGIFTRELVVDKMCHAPAELYNIDKRGYLRKGYYADIAVVTSDTPYEVTDGMALSRCGWTPLDGTILHNRVVMTFVNGKKVYSHGTISPDASGHELKYNRKPNI